MNYGTLGHPGAVDLYQSGNGWGLSPVDVIRVPATTTRSVGASPTSLALCTDHRFIGFVYNDGTAYNYLEIDASTGRLVSSVASFSTVSVVGPVYSETDGLFWFGTTTGTVATGYYKRPGASGGFTAGASSPATGGSSVMVSQSGLMVDVKTGSNAVYAMDLNGSGSSWGPNLSGGVSPTGVVGGYFLGGDSRLVQQGTPNYLGVGRANAASANADNSSYIFVIPLDRNGLVAAGSSTDNASCGFFRFIGNGSTWTTIAAAQPDTLEARLEGIRSPSNTGNGAAVALHQPRPGLTIATGSTLSVSYDLCLVDVDASVPVVYRTGLGSDRAVACGSYVWVVSYGNRWWSTATNGIHFIKYRVVRRRG